VFFFFSPYEGVGSGLFLAGGFGFLAETLNASRHGGWFAGIRSTANEAGSVATALIEQGLLDAAVLTDPETAEVFSPSTRRHRLTSPGRLQPARREEGGPWPTERPTE